MKKASSNEAEAGWTPTPDDLAWCRQLVSITKDGALWGNSYGVYRINKKAMQLELVEAWDENFRRGIHDRNVIAFAAIGWKVTGKPTGKYKKPMKEET